MAGKISAALALAATAAALNTNKIQARCTWHRSNAIALAEGLDALET
jgi:hypothetical protein